MDYLFLNSDKEDKKYYIGVCNIIPKLCKIDPFFYILNCCISPNTFFAFSFNLVKLYLKEYSVIFSNFIPKIQNTVNIFQLSIENNTYHVIIKTYWLRIIQRYWKKIFNLRKQIIQKRQSILSQRYFELNGKYPIGCNKIPSYWGNFKH